ncbi:MAG: PD40 domain-containing protein [Candidatus Solibacter usitatus]|nr:PD40 domain-containing protein [Candidatus Solibacter usitatus]
MALRWHGLLLVMLAAGLAGGCFLESDLQRELRGRLRAEGLHIIDCRQSGYQAFAFEAVPSVPGKWPEGVKLAQPMPSGRDFIGTTRKSVICFNRHNEILWEKKTTFEMLVAGLAVSPDGSWLAYRTSPSVLVGRASADQAPMAYVFAPMASPGAYTKFAEGEDLESYMLGWSNDNERIVIGLAGEIRVYERRTGKYRVLARGRNPSWSPDGRWIAYHTSEGGAFVADPGPWKTSRIDLGGEVLNGMQWSPDSRYLLGTIRQRHFMGDTCIVVWRQPDGAHEVVLRPPLDWTNQDFGWIFLRPRGPE